MGGGEVRHLAEAGPQRPDLHGRAGVVLLEGEGVLDQVLVPPGSDHSAEAVTCPARRDQPGAGRVVGPRPPGHGHRLLAGRVRERVRVGDQVQDVVGVQVRDQGGVEVHVVQVLAELREHAVAAVEQQTGVAILDQVAAAGASGILPRRRLPQHGDPHVTINSR